MKALIFPGQGSQKVGMAKGLVEKFVWAAEMAVSLQTPKLMNCCFRLNRQSEKSGLTKVYKKQ